jgi:hypothetical protein
MQSKEKTVIELRVSDQDLATILAALGFYQEHGQGEPANRSDAIHDRDQLR